MQRVLLAAMPLARPNYPNLALSTLQPLVEAAGFGCDIRYFSLDYLDRIGAAAHDRLTDTRCYMSHVGEWVFAASANPATDAADTSFLTEVFAPAHPELYGAERVLGFLAARADAAAFIADCLDAVDWSRYAVVGFTTSFQQTMASLALAARIRERHPQVLIVFGGANCQDEMGLELHRQYGFIDSVCLGEGETAFPELLRRHAAGEALAGIPGMVVRAGGASVPPAAAAAPVADLDTLPIPDFDAFFAARATSPTASRYQPALVIETARGCWWGARSHCTFCGLNGTTMAFRAKSQARAWQEIMALTARHDCRDIASADNILDMRYFRELLPRLADADQGLFLFFEVKSNLRPEQLDLLARAGVRKIQPGIESLDSGLLRLMRKGCTGLQNVQLLKLCAEAGIYVEWLALHGFPGETPAQHETTAALARILVHLQPPGAFLRVRADRFSPYHADPAAWGIAVAPLPAYRHLFPFPPEVVARLAYHFSMAGAGAQDLAGAPAGAAVAWWREQHAASGLWMEEAASGALVVHDERAGRMPATHRLAGPAADLLRRTWRIAAWREVLEASPHGAASLRVAAAALIADGLLLEEDGSLLTPVLRGRHRAPTIAEARRRDASKEGQGALPPGPPQKAQPLESIRLGLEGAGTNIAPGRDLARPPPNPNHRF
jgi:ribosomal peptide maturation radical SAM protein 1